MAVGYDWGKERTVESSMLEEKHGFLLQDLKSSAISLGLPSCRQLKRKPENLGNFEFLILIGVVLILTVRFQSCSRIWFTSPCSN